MLARERQERTAQLRLLGGECFYERSSTDVCFGVLNGKVRMIASCYGNIHL